MPLIFRGDQIKVHAPKRTTISPEDKEHFFKVDELFDSYKCYIDRYLENEGGTKKSFIEEIRSYAEVFRKFFNTKAFQCPMPKEAGEKRINTLIFGLGNTPLVSYVLYVLKNVNDVSERSNIFAYLESYVMRRVVAKRSNKNYNRLFGETLITKKAITLEKLSRLVNSLKGENAMPDDDELMEGFLNTPLNNKQARGVLYFIETYNKTVYHSATLKGFSKFSLEHIMPKKWQMHWNRPKLNPVEAKERDRILKTLGNLTIVPVRLNSVLQNKPWKNKKKKLKEFVSDLATFKKHFDRLEWRKAEIASRARHLFNLAKKCWGT
jgi:hypothetical protein